MGWIDYLRAYDMVSHWVIELKYDEHSKICGESFRKNYKSCRVELTCSVEALGEVTIKRRIFKGMHYHHCCL